MDNQIGNGCSILPIIFRCCDNGELAFKTLKARSSRRTKGFMLIPFCNSCSLLHIDGRNQHWEGQEYCLQMLKFIIENRVPGVLGCLVHQAA